MSLNNNFLVLISYPISCLLSYGLVINWGIDSLNYSKPNVTKSEKTFIDRLNDKEFMLIAFSKSGCFTDKVEYSSIKVSREGEDYYIQSSGNIKKISTEKRELIKQFELQLDSVSLYYKCTNSDHYLLRYKKETKNIMENTCSWHGYENLVQKLWQ
jgi:hypothetical protein